MVGNWKLQELKNGLAVHGIDDVYDVLEQNFPE